MGEWPRLLTHGGVYKTLKGYIHMVREFLRCWRNDPKLRERVPSLVGSANVDRAMAWWLDKRCYDELRGVNDAKQARSGLLHLAPEMKGELPWASRAVKTWEKMEENLEREPICKEFASLLIESIGRRGGSTMGYGAWSQLDCGMRVQDLDSLLTDDVHPGHKENVSLELGVLERGESTKTGTSQGVEVLHPDLCRWFLMRKEYLGPGQKVFDFEIPHYEKIHRDALAEYGLEDLEGAHVWRHSFAIHLHHYEGWPLVPDVQNRGR